MARRYAGSAGKITNRQIGVFAAYVSRHCRSAQGRWVAADSVCGVGEIETALRGAGKGYVLGVNGSHLFHSWGDKPAVAGTAEETAQALPASAWARLSAGEGTRGLRLHDWAHLELADLEAAEYGDGLLGLWMRSLLIRQSIADGELAFCSTWCPGGTVIEILVKTEGHCWAIEDGFATARNELGLDHNETRSPRRSSDRRTCGDGPAGTATSRW